VLECHESRLPDRSISLHFVHVNKFFPGSSKRRRVSVTDLEQLRRNTTFIADMTVVNRLDGQFQSAHLTDHTSLEAVMPDSNRVTLSCHYRRSPQVD
jgi:hypothetical protein